ncbi:hypothetical protein BH20ACI2_BH20ACI2_20270 [soil metagenome]
MHQANYMSRFTVVSFFAAIAFLSILVLSPSIAGQSDSGLAERRSTSRYALSDEADNTIGTRRHKLIRSSESNLFLPKDSAGLGIFDGNIVQSPTAPDISPNIVISQIYGGGGNSGALYTHDFIELFNRGNSSVNVNGWSVQFAAAGASSWTQTTALPNVTLQPGQYLLIQQASAGANGSPLPTADVIGSIPMDTASGKVALVSNTTTLTGPCPTGGAIVDFVGYGIAANCSEGVPVGTATSFPSAINAAKRNSGGCTDNDLNRNDFAISVATPRNTASSTNVCIGPTTGGKIAFISNRSGVNAGDSDIFIMNADGSGQTRLTTDPGPEQYPSFSTDGTKIVFTRSDKVYVMNVDGTSQTELTSTTGNVEPRFSPDGSKIVFSSSRDGNREIYVMNANGTNPTRLTNNSALDRYPVFSPDGSKIAFTSDRDGWLEIYIMNADGTNQVRLTTVSNRDSSAPVFSPDGSRIAFESDRFGSGSAVNIYIMDVNGSNATRLTTALDDFAPAFSPDGGAITFYTSRHASIDAPNQLEVYTMNVDGTNQRNVSLHPSSDLEPSWGIVAGSLTVTNVDSPGGSGAFGVGAVIPVTVTFGAPVTVTGTPRLILATGGTGFPVNYTSGSGTAVLTFTYTVQAGHASADLDYTSTAALVLNGGTINSFGGTPATLTLPAPGATGSLGFNRNIIIDTIAPDTTILTGPSGFVASTSATFTFSSTETGTFECKLDTGTFSPCTSGIVYNGLSQGSHTFEVRAKDTAMNLDPTPASRTWTVDTVAPDTTINSGPSGSVSSSSATFTFSSNEGSVTFECSLNGGAFTLCTSPTTYNGLAEGARTFAVRATDQAGNQDASPATRNWTVDTIAPDTTINTGPSGTVPSTIANFTFSSNEGGVTFECSLDGAAYTLCSSPAIYGGLSQGQHTFNVRAVDAAGNLDPSPATRTWTADTVAPDTTIDSGPTQNSSVSNTSATFNFSSNEAGSTFQCQIDGGGFSSCTSPTTYNSLSQGSHNFQVSATDAAGNTDATPAVRTWTVDTIAPDTFIDSGPSGFVSSTSATFTFSSNEAGVTFLCSINGGVYSSCTSPATYNGLADGLRSYGVRAVDAAGNQDGSPATRSWTIDTVPPDTTIHVGPTGTVASTSATFQFSSNEGGATFQCQLGGSFTACTSPITYNSLAQGPHTFYVRAVDQAGNVDPTPAERTWTIDSSNSISGNIKQAPGTTNLAGVTVTLSSCANGTTTTDGSGNFSFSGLYSGTCTITPSGLSKFYNTISRTYTNVANSLTGVDFTAYNSLAEAPTKLRIINPYVVPGQSAVVRVILDTPVAVNRVAFSVDYDEAMFAGAPVVACGSDAGAGCSLTVVPGSVGITVVPQGGTFAAGTREVVTLTFQTQATLASNALMDITGSPTSVLIRNAANDPLLVELIDGHIVYQQGFEGDLGGRPAGDGTVFSNDVIIARQFAVGTLAFNAAYNEFQRMDSAPRATLGDGVISSGDVIQARNYAAGNNPPTAAGGPFGPNMNAPPPAMLSSGVETPRAVKAMPSNAVAGYKVTVPVEMKALGDELAIRFTLEYDAMKLSKPIVSLAGVAPADAVLTVNDKESGRLTILIDSGTAFSSSGMQLLQVTFDVAATATTGETRISFAGDGSVADAMTNELPASYTDAFITINGLESGGVGISGRVLTPDGNGVRNARITIYGPDGYLRTVATSTLGYYSFDGVPAGRTYRIGVNSKQYRFESRTVETSADLAGLDFVGLE